MQYPTGALKDVRRPREEVHFYTAKAEIVPVRIDHSPYNPWPFYQDGSPQCVGDAFSEMMCNDLARQGVIPAGLPLYLSPTHIYNMARKLGGTLARNEGCYPENAATAICENGVVPYTSWPCKYDKYGNIIFDPTDPDAYASLAIKLPNMVKSRIDNGVSGLLAALADGVATVAVPWFPEWGSSYRSGILPPIANKEMSARHDLEFDGFNQEEGMFYFVNTHGEWGIQESAMGLRPFRCGGKMPFEYFEVFKSKFNGYDAWNINNGAVGPLPKMQLSLTVNGQKGCYGSGLYDPGQKVEIFAGAVAGYTFNRWYPGQFVDNLWSAKTTIIMRDVIELHTSHKKLPASKRCCLFDIAKQLNQKEGI